MNIIVSKLIKPACNRGYSAVAENSSMRVWRSSSGTNAVLVPLVYAYIYHCACTFFRILYLFSAFFLHVLRLLKQIILFQCITTFVTKWHLKKKHLWKSQDIKTNMHMQPVYDNSCWIKPYEIAYEVNSKEIVYLK